ncbi:DNA-3-methyladenine glycosylase II [Rhodoblastus acidophilus]|uniref:DNA-3-methyladenine glycosylase II n=1 Tax=Rhodoblastus acidophilus TaxID=1074 RepID=A0A212PXP2_RHOAC|nr:AlkA N-terminal domain-containing protein [Rhodoblastus acidophilus]PPQ38769.1 3-methyladenine DNA glycosylase 2 [Rhodoblastus acidophilus]RAI20763.1 3-methyladenine DNA glycosylase 2 [Rhodoblastus acidophilus]SNB51807.1 DNA-3-methyladenine glycosylase II [Rhodoblastus acidophilus]
MDLAPDACYRAICARDSRFDGRLFTGVKTTRIYCRPVCPARTPRLENVAFFPTAAAAQEAGFRPCLRCRPETAPDLGAWRGASNTVSRALALIEMGALDQRGVEALAERVGVGERQLRRLFARHLGASPIAVAQTRRVLLARQLIQETSLPMTEVALAAGFDSLRRFNETFLALYRRPPTALRRAGGVEASSGEIALALRFKPPYDWTAILGFLGARAIAGVESVEGGSYRRAIALEGEHGVVSVAPSGADALKVVLRLPKLALLPGIIARLRRVFDLAADPEAVAADLARDPKLAPLVAARPGLRVPGGWDGFELAVRAILGQQVTVAGAARCASKLTERYGEPLRCADPVLSRIFTTPAALAGADFSGFGLPSARAETLRRLAQTVAADPDFLSARHAPAEVMARLRGLPGVGEWTAQYFALRMLREPDAFPADDLDLRRAMAEDGARPTPKNLLARANLWRPWRAYAAQHLWTAGSVAPAA